MSVSVADSVVAELARALQDHARSEPPAHFPRDPTATAQPGLYSWWCDEEGRKALAAVLGFPLPALIYAGQAGATKWPSGSEGAATLYSRIRQMHLARKIEFSTFRITLAALLRDCLPLQHVGVRRLATESEERLTAWMCQHLRVAAIPYPDRSTLGAAEHAVLTRLDPPLNLSGMPPSPIRQRLSHLRSQLARSPGIGTTHVPGSERAPARGPAQTLRIQSNRELMGQAERAIIDLMKAHTAGSTPTGAPCAS